MAKTTNILDLNNRLEKVEKENVAQNSYTSLKNKPKINGVTLTGNKSLADLGAAAAGDITNINTAIGDVTQLPTTADDLVGAISELDDNTVKSSLVQLGLVAIQANTLTLLHTLSGTENYDLLGAIPKEVVDDQQTDVTHQIQLFIKGTSIYGLVDHAGNYNVLAAVFFKNKEV